MCVFVLFVRVKSFRLKNKTALIPSFILLLNSVVLTSSLQCCFIKNTTTSLGCLLIDVVFRTLVQRHDMMEQRLDVKTTATKFFSSNRTHKEMPRQFWLVTLQNCWYYYRKVRELLETDTPQNCWYYYRKMRELLEIDKALVSYGQDKVLNRNNGNFAKTILWKPLFRKMTTPDWNWRHFILRNVFLLYLD